MTVEQNTPYRLESVVLHSSSYDTTIDIKYLVTDIDIFEHLDKPYLTATMMFTDTRAIMTDFDIRSSDVVTIKIEYFTEDPKIMMPYVDKTFRIDKVLMSSRSDQNEDTEVFIVHLIEAHWYESNLKNVNKSYSGTPSTIVAKIAKEFVEKEVMGTANDIQDMKMIIPNLTPVDAMCWVKNRMTTTEGYPFYLHSRLRDDKLHLFDIKTMMQLGPWNGGEDGVPYVNNASSNAGATQRRRVIKNHDHRSTSNLLDMIDKALIGSKYQYYDVLADRSTPVEFDIVKHVMEPLDKDGLLGRKRFYTDDFKVDDTPFNEMTNRVITQIGGFQGFEGTDSFNQSKETSQYRLNIISRTIKNLMTFNPMTVTVDGFDYLTTVHMTIGVPTRILFQSANMVDEEAKYDPHKSGDYLVFAAKHSFKTEGYDVSLSCVKLSNGGVEE